MLIEKNIDTFFIDFWFVKEISSDNEPKEWLLEHTSCTSANCLGKSKHLLFIRKKFFVFSNTLATKEVCFHQDKLQLCSFVLPLGFIVSFNLNYLNLYNLFLDVYISNLTLFILNTRYVLPKNKTIMLIEQGSFLKWLFVVTKKVCISFIYFSSFNIRIIII